MAEALKLIRDEKAPYEVRIKALELAISLSGFEVDKKSAKAAKVEKASSSSRKRLADLLN